MDLKQRAQRLKKDIPAVFLALKHKDTPILAKIVAAITVGYGLVSGRFHSGFHTAAGLF